MSEQLPDYQRPFEQEDFRGYFTWTDELTEKINSNSLYHACHEEELNAYLIKNRLELRSKWALKLPEHGICEVPGVWTGLNYFNNGNQYGPLLISFPLSVLNNRHFMVFRRGSSEDRKRYFFVQYEARIPIYSCNKKAWRLVNPETYFSKNENGSLNMKRSAIYDIVLTQSLSLKKSEMRPINHPKCIPGKCGGMIEAGGRNILREIAKSEFKKWLLSTKEYEHVIKKFPVLDGVKFELFDPELE